MSARRESMNAAMFAPTPKAAIDAAVRPECCYRPTRKLARIPIRAQKIMAVVARFASIAITTQFVRVEMVSRLIQTTELSATTSTSASEKTSKFDIKFCSCSLNFMISLKSNYFDFQNIFMRKKTVWWFYKNLISVKNKYTLKNKKTEKIKKVFQVLKTVAE